MLKRLLKKRKYALKNKLYLEADYLNQTAFKIGVGVSYHIDNQTQTITVKPSEEASKNHVSAVTQTRTQKVVPTIDIRKSDVRTFLNQAAEWEVSVYEDQIIFSVVSAAEQILDVNLLKTTENKVVDLATVREGRAQAFAVPFASQKVVGGAPLVIKKAFQIDAFSLFNPTKLKEKVISMISLFSGCGMLDKGFLDDGHYDIKFAIDMFEKKRLQRYHLDTYRHNIGDHIREGNVLDLTPNDIPRADFVAGGVPCVKFSKLNTKDNFRDSLQDEFPLLEQFLNVVEWSQAKGFLIENVKEFISAKGELLLDRIKSRMSAFSVVCRVISSDELGSAQKRPRAFILGLKGAVPTLEIPMLKRVRTVRDAFEGVEDAPQFDLRLGLKGDYLKRAAYIPQGGNLFDVPEEFRPNRSFGNAIQRLHYDRPAPTITGVDSDYVLHPTEDRKIGVREIARLFSLPDDFIFYGSVTSMVTQLKNGVDYRVSRFLAQTIYKQLSPLI